MTTSIPLHTITLFCSFIPCRNKIIISQNFKLVKHFFEVLFSAFKCFSFLPLRRILSYIRTLSLSSTFLKFFYFQLIKCFLLSVLATLTSILRQKRFCNTQIFKSCNFNILIRTLYYFYSFMCKIFNNHRIICY